ncbi:retrovirus-related pol polyprotein from transposon TNT 1-94 [Tanacetum coccineum]
MLAPKGPTFNGRPTFTNPIYLKKAQSKKPCLYAFPYDQSDPANRLVPDREETLTLEKESRSKLNKDLVRPYDYTKLNSLYEIFKPPTQEYHVQLAHANEYVESLENEIDELESNKAEFSNMYDILLQECVSNDVMCSYLHSLSDLDAYTELQCLYLHKVKECECLAQKLSKQTETVSKEVCNELLRSFTKLEKHSISLELGLQQCQEQMKNDTVCKEKASNVFMKEREQYFEIQDLKAQLQDKNISIKEAKKKVQLHKDKALSTKPSVQQSARLPDTANDIGYGDYHIGNVAISRVYYVEGLGHNLFFVGQFCDSNLEVAFRQHTCFIRNIEGNDLLTGSRCNNLYTLSIGDMMASSPICLLSKASKTKSWVWHRRLSHLNFGAINHLARHGLVRGLSKLIFENDHLCSACAMGKSKKKPHKPKSQDTNQEKLYLLHMDLCGPMRVASVNGKKYILIIVDDYSLFTWVKCLQSKDEAPDFIIKFLKMI